MPLSVLRRSLLALALLVGASALRSQTIISSGHIDLNIGYNQATETWSLDAHYRVSAPLPGNPNNEVTQSTSVNSVIFYLPDAGIVISPGGAYARLAPAGSPIWIVPQVQNQSIPWVGFGGYGQGGTESAPQPDFNAFDLVKVGSQWVHQVSVSFVGFSGPEGAQFGLWQNPAFGGPTVLWSTVTGGTDAFSKAPDVFKINYAQHAHYNWGFSQPGIYEIEVVMSGTIDGVLKQSEPFTITYAVGTGAIPEPSSYAVLGGVAALAFTGFSRRFRRRA